jgi:membrane protein YqaA with SNARE-associated domain
VAVVTPEAVLTRYWRPTVRFCRPHVRPALLLLAVGAASVALVFLPINYKALGVCGYLGVFLVTLLGTSAMVLPVPYLGFVAMAGRDLDPLLVGLVAGAAAALGELTGYLVGYTGRALIGHNRWYGLLERQIGRFGGPIVLLGAAVPNPVFDAIGVVAGATRMPVGVFLLACFLGRAVRLYLVALLGTTLPPAG